MKILIVSDTHGRMDNYYEVLQLEHDVDMVIHCGDLEGTEDEITRSFPGPVVLVPGNNDFFSRVPREREFELGPYRIWVTHGHSYYVSTGTDVLRQEAVARGIDIALFGHIHRPLIQEEDGVLVMNPGSLVFPRQDGRKPSYIVMDLNMNTKEMPVAEVRYLRRNLDC